MANQYELAAETRKDQGKGASRRLRRLAARVPGIMYGAGKTPTPIHVGLKELSKALENESFYSHILTIVLDGKAEKAVLRDMQRHPVKNIPTHIDLQRVDENVKLTMRVPLHFINEDICNGVKEQGGEIHHDLSDVEVSCLPKHLPEFLTVDMAAVNIGNHVHLSDIKLPEGVTLVQLAHGHDLAVVNVHAVKVAADETPAAAAAPAEGEKAAEKK
ncbi:MAG: 50S ribosomal protein L25/general stress protein Ctc [Gammaproteobacteria bacterium]